MLRVSWAGKRKEEAFIGLFQQGLLGCRKQNGKYSRNLSIGMAGRGTIEYIAGRAGPVRTVRCFVRNLNPESPGAAAWKTPFPPQPD